MQSHSLDNLNIWIVGASSGIGAELVRLLAKRRNYIFISARSQRNLDILQEAYPQNVKVIPCDVASTESLSAVSKRLYEETDHIDLFIYCAGICEYSDGGKISLDMYERITHTNYLGAVATLNIVLPLLRKSQNFPQVVGLSSLASLVPFPRAGAYGASKVALEYFLQSIAIDLRDENIAVSIIRPGFVDTPLTQKNDFDMPFLMSTKDAANEILDAITKRKMVAEFPWKLTLPLKIFRYLPKIWREVIAPRFRKPELL